MKKIITIAVCIAALSLVGCSSTNRTDDGTSQYRDTVSQAGQHKAKYKHYRKGKLGMERNSCDTNK